MYYILYVIYYLLYIIFVIYYILIYIYIYTLHPPPTQEQWQMTVYRDPLLKIDHPGGDCYLDPMCIYIYTYLENMKQSTSKYHFL